VPADRIDPDTMTIEEALITPILEIWSEFSLTEPQVAHEDQLTTAMTLATRSMTRRRGWRTLRQSGGRCRLSRSPLRRHRSTITVTVRESP
jgi:hypothetical protein